MKDNEIFEHIAIESRSFYPISGGDEEENTFIIKYKLFGIVKNFEIKSSKSSLSIEDVQAEIFRHEKGDHTNNTMCEKPPLGITPHFIWIEQRIDEIKEAINRRIEAKENIPHEWYIELAQLENERIANTTHLEIKVPEGSNMCREIARKNFCDYFDKREERKEYINGRIYI